MAELRRLGYEGIAVRHLMGDLVQTPAERFAPEEGHLAHALAIKAATEGRGTRCPSSTSAARTRAPPGPSRT